MSMGALRAARWARPLISGCKPGRIFSLPAILAGCLFFALACAARAEPLSFVDDAGQIIQITSPARRIVALSPHITEMLFHVGAGDQVVGVAQASDFPPAAKRLPAVARHDDINLEALMRLKPDAVVAWGNGAANPKLDRLKALGVRVIYSDPQTMGGIAENLQRMAQLAGTEALAQPVIDAWRARLAQLESQNMSSGDVRADDPLVFYQVWDRPLMTVNRRHIIAHAIRACGGRPQFADLPLLTPTVSLEAVVRGNPDIILYTQDPLRSVEWGRQWMAWKKIRAVAANQIFGLPPDLLVRAGPRFLDGAERVCQVIQRVKDSR